MGCCMSGHSEASAVEVPPPMFGKDVKVKLQKQGWFDADFNILDCNTEGGEEKPGKWMLLDAVGGMSDSAFDYFVKYRAKGMEESQVLGCANLKKEHDYMWYEVRRRRQLERPSSRLLLTPSSHAFFSRLLLTPSHTASRLLTPSHSFSRLSSLLSGDVRPPTQGHASVDADEAPPLLDGQGRTRQLHHCPALPALCRQGAEQAHRPTADYRLGHLQAALSP